MNKQSIPNEYKLSDIYVTCKKLSKDAIKPKKAYRSDSGYDIFSIETVVIPAYKIRTIKTGISLDMPTPIACQIRSRSGLARNHGVFIANSPGTIDNDYTGEIMIIMYNSSDKNYLVSKGDSIGQIIFELPLSVIFNLQDESVNSNLQDELSGIHRGSNGFGSSDNKEQTNK